MTGHYRLIGRPGGGEKPRLDNLRVTAEEKTGKIILSRKRPVFDGGADRKRRDKIERMSNRKNYNSLVFLTTLSVYLGLVLVGGATPSVLAQAALTRNFDIQSEIVIEDDLDKKPDDAVNEDVAVIEKYKIAEAIIDFVADLKKLKSIGKFDSENDWSFSQKIVFEEFTTTVQTSKTADFANRWLEPAVADLTLKLQPEDLSTVSEYVLNPEKQNSRETVIEVQSTTGEFLLRLCFAKKSPEQARLVADAFNRFFVAQKVGLKHKAALSIYENTKAHTENNQIFVVTRLPRASIDALLAAENAR